VDEGNKAKVGEKVKGLKILVEYGPLAVFFITYSLSDLFTATAAIIIATLLVFIFSVIVERRVPVMPLVTGVIIVFFGGLTLWLKDETFIKMKPTIIQAVFGVVLLGGLYTKHLFLEKLMGGSLKMERKGWAILTRRLAFFFFSMALLNELIWRTQSTDFWVNFKVFGILILTIIFLVAQMALLKKYISVT